MEKILVPVDGSEYSNKAVHYAVSLAKGNNAELVLLNVQPSYNTPNVKRFVSQNQIREYQEELSAMAIESSLAVVNGEVQVGTKVRIGDPGTEICAEAIESNASNIIMGYRGLGAIKRTVLGSVSYHVLHNAPCPVTIVP